jgi:hypothetical protein
VRPRGIGILTAIFVVSLAWFAIGVEQSGLASVDVDPISHIAALDDAVYAHEAIVMDQSGDWLTPIYLGRYALNKPPLLQWLAAASIRLFGISAWALRVPSLLSAAFATTLIFAAVWRRHSLLAAAAAAILLLSSHMFYVFSRVTMMDMLLTLWIVVALVTVLRDPALARTSSLVVFGAATGAAVLTKAAAGTVPLIALAIHAAAGPRGLRPNWRRVFSAGALAAAVALPWHLYQFAVHARWFIAEYILTQHFAIGLAAPPNYSSENHVLFYARRLLLTDPILSLSALASLPFLLRNWRKHFVVLLWVATFGAALLSFRYQSAYYVLPLLPMFAIMGGEAFARVPVKFHRPLAAALLACLVIKVAFPAEPWGISAGRATQRAIAPSLDRYCSQHRSNELIMILSDDQFYASDLPLPHLRYCLLDKRPAGAPRPPLDFAWLGINATVPEFNHFDLQLPTWRRRLSEFGLPSSAPVATVISAASTNEIRDLIAAHPQSDFWIPAALLRSLDLIPKHQVVQAGDHGVFLLAPESTFFAPSRPCHL